MKPTIGPYVAVRDLSGADSGQAVRTVRATDRLTGMPVLLHVLPRPVPLPQQPPHTRAGSAAPLMFPTDAGMDGEAAYLVTELPLAAVPATDPVLAARGALAALSALHGAGLSHGGVGPAQLWSVDGEVLLAGAGLPWSDTPGTPQDDLRDLARTLEQLGGLPAPLRPLRDAPGTLSALDALKRLNGEVPGERPVPAAPVPAPAEAPATLPHPPESVSPGQTAEVQAQGREPPAPAQAADPEPQSVNVIVASVTPEALAPAPADVPADVPDDVPDEMDPPPPPPPTGETRSSEVPPGTAPPVEALDAGYTGGEAVPDESVRVISRAGETPQERRRREREAQREQAEQDAALGARRREERIRAQREAEQAMDTDGADPRAEVGRLPSRRAQREPIRIGWDDEDNLRLLREPPAAPPRPAWPTWLLPLLAALLLLGAGVWAARTLTGQRAAAPATTQATPATSPARTPVAQATPAAFPVPFEVRGQPGAQARVVVLRAPAAANLKAGTLLGTAPGTLNFPAAGTYRVKVTASGYAPARYDLSVPRTAPVTIALKP